MADLLDAASIAQQARAVPLAAESVRGAMRTAATNKIAALVAQLNKQFAWLGKNQQHAQWTEFFDRWEADLRHYEAACDALAVVPEETQGRLIA